MKNWKTILIVAVAAISMIVYIGFSVCYIYQYSFRIVRRVASHLEYYDHSDDSEDFDESEILDDDEPFYEEEDETAEEEFLRIDTEMRAVAEYLYTNGRLAGVEASDRIDLTYTPMMDAKGWPYAVVYQEETEFDGGVKGYKVQKITYDYMKNYEGQDEFVYEEEYCDENGNVVMYTQILGFFLVDKDTLEVTDENTDQWH